MIDRWVLVAAALAAITQARLNPKGPQREIYTVQCFERLAVTQFKYVDPFGHQEAADGRGQLLTVLTTTNMNRLAFDVQHGFIQRLHQLMKFTVEVIEDFRPDTGLQVKTRFCVMVVENITQFERKLQLFQDLPTFDHAALVLVFFMGGLGEEEVMLSTLWEHSLTNSAILTPKTLRTLQLHTLKYRFESHRNCMEDIDVTIRDTCVNGVWGNPNQNYFRRGLKRATFNDCVVDVFANKIEPFVIDVEHGFEIEILHIVGESLKIHFNVTITGDDSWGEKGEEGYYTNGLGLVQNCSCLGVGDFYATSDHLKDFDVTIPHFVSDLVWVVPMAGHVPKWRVLTVIFSWHVWMVCLGLVVASAICMRLTAKRWDFSEYRERYFLTGFQVLIMAAVYKQPKSDWTRVVFISLAVFSIIVSSVYTSSLINYLTRPQREPQVDSIEGVLSRGYRIGGLPIFEAVFNVTDDAKSMTIFNMYESNDSVSYWMTSVAKVGDTCSLGTEFYLKYMIAERNPLVTDQQDRPQVYIIKKKIFSYSVGFVVSRRFHFIHKVDNVIQKMNVMGLVDALTRKHLRKLEKAEAMREAGDFVQALTVHHLQGAFAILILGYVMGLVLLLLEVGVACVKKALRR